MRIADVDRLVAGVAPDPDVLGVVLLGSAADQARADEWSDVDLWLVVAEGTQDRHREELSWLPGHDGVVVVARETEHGRAVVFDDGSYVELAVASPGDLAVLGAEYVLRLLPRGTHDWSRFLKPSELARHARAAALSVEALAGISYAPLSRTYRISKDTSVNYLMACRRGTGQHA